MIRLLSKSTINTIKEKKNVIRIEENMYNTSNHYEFFFSHGYLLEF